MIKKFLEKQLILIMSLLMFESCINQINAAEKIMFIKGIFSRSISTEDLNTFVSKGEKNELLRRTIKKKDEDKVILLLSKEHKAPIVLTSKLLYSNIGNVILKRVSKVIYPIRVNDEYTRTLAIRSAVIKALASNNEKISILSFIEAYPTKVVAINIDELEKVINKVESMSELVEFFSDSPLEKLK